MLSAKDSSLRFAYAIGNNATFWTVAGNSLVRRRREGAEHFDEWVERWPGRRCGTSCLGVLLNSLGRSLAFRSGVREQGSPTIEEGSIARDYMKSIRSSFVAALLEITALRQQVEYRIVGGGALGSPDQPAIRGSRSVWRYDRRLGSKRAQLIMSCFFQRSFSVF